MRGFVCLAILLGSAAEMELPEWRPAHTHLGDIQVRTLSPAKRWKLGSGRGSKPYSVCK